MSSRNTYSTLYDTMRYFHSMHHRELSSMQEQCKQAKNIADLHNLASNISSFCHSLHVHHTIEDKHLFPRIARKTDISHLEAHHQQLAQLLSEFENFSHRLKQMKSADKDISTAIIDANSIVNRVSTLVHEHEAAEEQVIAPDNMKKWFRESEMKQFFNM